MPSPRRSRKVLGYQQSNTLPWRVVVCLADGCVVCGTEALGVLTKRPPSGGQLNPSRGAAKQLHPHRAFESLDRLGRRRLGHREAFGCAAYVALVGHHKELLEQPPGQFHICIII